MNLVIIYNNKYYTLEDVKFIGLSASKTFLIIDHLDVRESFEIDKITALYFK